MSPPVRHALVAKLLYGTRYTLFDLFSHELHGLARIVDYTDRVNLVSLCVLCALVVKLLYGVRSTRFALISHELHGLARIVNKPFHWKNLRVSTTRRTVHAKRRSQVATNYSNDCVEAYGLLHSIS